MAPKITDFTCKGCNVQLPAANIARQTMAVPSCHGEYHAGPFEPVYETSVRTRPEVVVARRAVDL